MQKCCKTLIWIFCAVVILLGLGVAIYFIVDDAIDKKIESCMFQHFHQKGLLERYNVTVDKSSSPTSTYSTEDCSSIIEEGLRKTRVKVEAMAQPPCLKQKIVSDYLDAMMLGAMLDRIGRNGLSVKQSVFASAQATCTANQPYQS